MTPPDNNQASNKPDNQDSAKTVILIRCAKHGIAYMEKEGCPECEKERKPSGGKTAG